ncbi:MULTISPECIES: nitroreductase [Acinetobacter]|uniref:Nitroreductase n=1 Tax=Acinetobacter pollinis TaxID=2605270 RepID=A0ABU6DRS1_9GAMM|nr:MULTISPECIES: nitroreductase [Acinetobacter]MBF7689328.1 nitroreductase [Acinetobacter pollinis]MBF7691990.1 nitroreductase [Acinetobacter pollinis]MBF7696873.1 nitroreductase [Acinetobacter pollinis]MBF7700095.1 nitroreductase [Acinetobacter pollinis]MEB5476550.1 nitroreductase [Acinetobacter pollinis]
MDNIQYIVDEVIGSRHSVRAFLPDQPVSKSIIESILAVSSRAPSGTNTQPWKVYVVSGKKRDEIVEKVCNAQLQVNADPSLKEQYTETFSYYPEKWISPYIDRRRENGWGLYGLLNIQRGEKEKMAAQQLRNYKLFDAPVGIFVTVNKAMGIGAKMDIAMMLQNIMLSAKARGLDTCPQAAWNHFHQIVLDSLNAPDDEELVCTIALGYADKNAPVNTFHTPREPVENFTTFLE